MNFSAPSDVASVAAGADAPGAVVHGATRARRLRRHRAAEGEKGGAAAGRDHGRVRAVLVAVLRAVHGGGVLRGLRRPQVPHGHHLAGLRQLDAQPHPLSAVQRQLQARLQTHAGAVDARQQQPPPPGGHAAQEHVPRGAHVR
jgi:hypothetical protein